MDPLTFSTAMAQLRAEFAGLTTKDDVERALERAPNEREPNALRAIVQTLRHLAEDEDYSTASDREASLADLKRIAVQVLTRRVRELSEREQRSPLV